MAGSLDLDAYLERVGWSGDLRIDLETLARLLRAHMLHIPFENLDVLLGRPVRLDVDSLQAKFVRAHRGGYCFEHASLFAAVLETTGFEPVRHASRVILFQSKTDSPRGHMFLTVPLPEGTYLVDPGFGPFAARAPLLLSEDAHARTDHEAHWLVREGNHWILRAYMGDKPVDAWISTMEPENPIDFEVANHYMATHPDSPMRNLLIMCAIADDGRVTVMNRDLSVRRGDERETTPIADRTAFRRLLVDSFGFDLPEAEQLHVPGIPEWS